jgi:hypothetical protein
MSRPIPYTTYDSPPNQHFSDINTLYERLLDQVKRRTSPSGINTGPPLIWKAVTNPPLITYYYFRTIAVYRGGIWEFLCKIRNLGRFLYPEIVVNIYESHAPFSMAFTPPPQAYDVEDDNARDFWLANLSWSPNPESAWFTSFQKVYNFATFISGTPLNRRIGNITPGVRSTIYSPPRRTPFKGRRFTNRPIVSISDVIITITTQRRRRPTRLENREPDISLLGFDPVPEVSTVPVPDPEDPRMETTTYDWTTFLHSNATSDCCIVCYERKCLFLSYEQCGHVLCEMCDSSLSPRDTCPTCRGSRGDAIFWELIEDSISGRTSIAIRKTRGNVTIPRFEYF